MNVIKDIDNESWGWFIDLESNEHKEIVKKIWKIIIIYYKNQIVLINVLLYII